MIVSGALWVVLKSMRISNSSKGITPFIASRAMLFKIIRWDHGSITAPFLLQVSCPDPPSRHHLLRCLPARAGGHSLLLAAFIRLLRFSSSLSFLGLNSKLCKRAKRDERDKPKPW